MDSNFISRNNLIAIDKKGKFSIEELRFIIKVDMVHPQIVEEVDEPYLTTKKYIPEVYKLTLRNYRDNYHKVFMRDDISEEKIFILIPVYESLFEFPDEKIVTYRCDVLDIDPNRLYNFIADQGFVYAANFADNTEEYEYEIESVSIHVYYQDVHPRHLIYRCYRDLAVVCYMDFIWTSQQDFNICRNYTNQE